MTTCAARVTAATYSQLGVVHFYKEEYSQAAFFLEDALLLAPDDVGIQRNLARVKAALGEGDATTKTAVDRGFPT